MNSVVFEVDDNDIILDCIYYEDYKSKQGIKINLPTNRIRSYFTYLVNQNGKINQDNNGYTDIFTFYDIDVDMIDSLIMESELYQYNMSVESNNKNNTIIRENGVKVTRINKFKKKAIKVSASLLIAISLFTVSKEEIKNINIKDIFSIPYGNPIDALRSQENIIKIDDNEETMIIDDWKYLDKGDNIESKPITASPRLSPNVVEENKNNTDGCLRLETDNLVDSEKYYMCKAYYLDSLSKIANRYGIDPSLAMAVGIHERGIHSDIVDSGGAVGLFQIQVEGGWNWVGKTIAAYNFESNEYENVLITKESVSDVFENMRVGCMMLQNLLVTYDYNVAKAITAYNYGSTNLSKVLEQCSLETHLSMHELNDIEHLEWLEYRNIIKGGDPEYLENVFKYIPNGTILSFTKPTNETISIQYDNLIYEANKGIK